MKERATGLKRSSFDKKEECGMDPKFNGGCGGGSEEDKGYILCSPLNANGIRSRKRIKLQGKLSEIRDPVDPALVPRRLRSAMSKRISQSASPPLSDSKMRQQHACNGVPSFSNLTAERCKQNMLNEVTKDEEEVAEALTSMANIFTNSNPVETKEDWRLLEDCPENKTSPSPLEATEEDSTKFLVPCNGGSSTEPSLCVEDTSNKWKADPPKLEQVIAASVSETIVAAATSPSQPNFLRKNLSNVEPVEKVTNSTDTVNVSNPLEASLKYFPLNGLLESKQLNNLLVQKQELTPWLLRPASIENDLKNFKQKQEGLSFEVSRKETDTDVQPGLRNRGCEQLSMPTSSKSAAYPNSVTVLGRPSSMNGSPTEKLSLTSTNGKQSCKNCITHVRISHLIRHHQRAEKKQPHILQTNQLKAKERTSCSVLMSGESGGSRNGTIPLYSASLVERSMLEARNQMLQDKRLLQTQQAAALPGAYVPQKQNCDIPSSSVAADARSSGNGIKSYEQPHVPYTPNHFTFPQGSFSSQYQEQLTSGAAQQVQLQLSHFIASRPSYGPQMGQSAGDEATKQQQQLLQQQQLMWQAHLAHYRPSVGLPAKWQQNGRQLDSSSAPHVSQSPSIFSLPADYKPHHLHQPFVLPMPSSLSSLSSISTQKQQRNEDRLNPQSSSHLQTICNAGSFR